MAEEHISTRELTDDEIEDRLVAALRQRKGEVTEADLVVASGLPPHQVAAGLRRLMVEYVSHLAVTSDGGILYRFDPRLIRRSARPWAHAKALGRAAWGLFSLLFKVMTGLVLLVYVGIFVLLLLLVLNVDVISLDGGMWTSLRKPQRLKRAWAALRGGTIAVASRCQTVFRFIFGPPTSKPDEFADERALLAFVRVRQGIVTPAEIIAQTGWPSKVADQESTRLVARYGGDVEVEGGEMLFVFRDLAEPEANAECPPPCWDQLEPPMDVTGNSSTADLVVAAVNAYVLISAVILVPLVFAPQIGFSLGSPGVRWVLIYVPALYAVGAFAIHAARRALLATPENRRRLQRNVRRLLVREAFAGHDVDAAAVASEVAGFPVPVTADAVRTMAEALALELDASIEPGDDGRLHFAWTRLRQSLAAANERRARLPAAKATDVIFSSDN
jgi:hypothetical protein